MLGFNNVGLFPASERNVKMREGQFAIQFFDATVIS